MAEILDYLDNINIDIAKKKYYNVNKVNMVLDELRVMAVALVEENEKQRSELAELKAEFAESQKSGLQTRDLLDSMQALYRDTLAKAHERADGIVAEAEAQSEQLTSDARLRTGKAIREMEACIDAIRTREEQNIEFLNASLRRFLLSVSEDTPTEESEDDDPDVQVQIRKTDLSAPQTGYEQGNTHISAPEESTDSQLKSLEAQIRRLAEEISALEIGK